MDIIGDLCLPLEQYTIASKPKTVYTKHIDFVKYPCHMQVTPFCMQCRKDFG